MRSTIDYVDHARRVARDEFVEAHPHWFLVGKRQMVAPPRRSTGIFPQIKNDTGEATVGVPTVDEVVLRADQTEPLDLVLPVVKRHGKGERITVGRTESADVVVPDSLISREHAWLVLRGAEVEVGDAGSQNGTFVGGHLLGGSERARVRSGDVVRFSHLEFELLSPGDAWDRLRNR